MPRYHFHTEDGQCILDTDGTELPDLRAARATAVNLVCDLLKNRPQLLLGTGMFTVTVTDENRLTLFTVNMGVTDAPALGAQLSGSFREPAGS